MTGILLKSFLLLFVATLVYSSSESDHEELLSWEPPENFIENYPYFLSGYDNEKRPVWVIELGRWDMRGMAEKDPQTIAEFDKYVHQMLYKLYDSPKQTGTNEFVVIEDMEGYTKRQLIHRATLKRQLELFKEFADMEKTQKTKLHKGYGINLNVPAKSVWGFVKPTLGALGPKIEVFGNKKWEEALLRDIPKTALPPWLGGYQNFTQVQTFGKRKFHVTKVHQVLEKE